MYEVIAEIKSKTSIKNINSNSNLNKSSSNKKLTPEFN
jgi:hypothetical protein